MATDAALRWGLQLGRPFASQVGYVLPACRGDGTPVVLKLNPPGEWETEHEADALAHWDGRGAARLLDRDETGTVLLLERCEPGTTLWDLDEDKATEAAATLLERLLVAPPPAHPFHTLADEAGMWIESLSRSDESPLVGRAIELLRALGPSQGELVLLHQDLHRGNILRATREPWLAIDPKPLVGEREFAAAPLVRDRLKSLDERLPPRRLAFYVERLDLDLARGWAVAQTVAWGLDSPTMLRAAESLLAAG